MQVGYKVDECDRKDCPYRTEPITNAHKIRAMSDEELAQEMIFFCPTDTVFNGTETYEKPHYTGLDGRYYSTSEELTAANLEWLQQPVIGLRAGQPFENKRSKA